MSDAAADPAQEPPVPPPVTAKTDPITVLWDLEQLAEFVDKLRASGVKSFRHPSGLELSFEPGGSRLPIRPSEGW